MRFPTVLMACVMASLWVPRGDAYGQQASPPSQGPGSAGSIPAAQLLQPEELVQILRSSGGERPLVFQVGPHVFYAQAHIPGSEYIGAGAQESGLQALRDRAKSLRHDQFIVLYCGCCPWTKCPNVWPAYEQLVSLGFSHVKVLYIANNFGANWVAKGYPVEKGR
jgi:thiosulfate/3-mercaptopyruvate sulfurtransferase